MRTIFQCVYGSKLFGVSTPESDLDLKGVYCASFDELVLGRTEATNSTNGLDGPDKIETENHFIGKFCQMVNQGQTLTYGMLFAPRDKWVVWTPEWEELVTNRHRLVSRSVLPFIGYARSQAQKYSLKGERLQTLQDFINGLRVLTPSGETGRLSEGQFELLMAMYGDRTGVRLWTEQTATQLVRHIEVCGKSFGETTPLKLWVEPLLSLQRKYGKRAMSAKESDGSDLKAMYHAVRLCGEMNELLSTGHISYPRPDAELLLAIRSGAYTNEQVAEMIDSAVLLGDELLKSTTLQESPDSEWLQEWLLRTQRVYA
jgi:hypothetical protein